MEKWGEIEALIHNELGFDTVDIVGWLLDTTSSDNVEDIPKSFLFLIEGYMKVDPSIIGASIGKSIRDKITNMGRI